MILTSEQIKTAYSFIREATDGEQALCDMCNSQEEGGKIRCKDYDLCQRWTADGNLDVLLLDLFETTNEAVGDPMSWSFD